MTPPDRSRPSVFVNFVWMPAMSTLGLGAVGDGDWRASSQVQDNVTSAGRSAGGWRALETAQLDGIHGFIKSKQPFVVRGHLCPGNHNTLSAPASLGDCQFWGGGELGRRSWYRVLVLHLKAGVILGRGVSRCLAGGNDGNVTLVWTSAGSRILSLR